MINYVFFDLETTGLNRDCDILEFGALIFDSKLKLQQAINRYYLCDTIPARATEVNGLTPTKLKLYNAIDWDANAGEIYDLVSRNDIILCGHNIEFYDVEVLKYNLEKAGFNWKPNTIKMLDTYKLYRAKYSGSAKLSAVTTRALAEMNSDMKTLEEMFRDSSIISDQIVDKQTLFHNSLFDSYCSFVSYYALMR